MTKNDETNMTGNSRAVAQTQKVKKGNPIAISLHLQHIVPPDEAIILVNRHGKFEYSTRREDVKQHREKLLDAQGKPIVDEKTGKEKERVWYERTARTPNSVYSAYAGLQKIQRIPLENLRVEVPEVKLNDSNMAEFQCTVVCFVRISDPLLASERTYINPTRQRYEGDDAPGTRGSAGRVEIHEDFKVILESVARTTATSQTILDTIKNRKQLQQSIEEQVVDVFPKWGLELVDLEIRKIEDVPGSHIIDNIQKKIDAEVAADAKVKIAQEDQRGRVEAANRDRDAKLAEFAAQEAAGKRQIERDQTLGIAGQVRDQQVQLQTMETNAKIVEANRKLKVGTAEYERDVTVTNADAARQKAVKEADGRRASMTLDAEGMKSKVVLEAEAAQKQAELLGAGEGAKLRQIGEGQGAQSKAIGEGEAAAIRAKGEAQGTAIKAAKVGEAEGIDRLAEAQKKYNDQSGAIQALAISALRDINLARAEAGGKMAANAHLNIITGDSQSLVNGGILGNLGIGPRQGMALRQLADAAGVSMEDMTRLAGAVLRKELPTAKPVPERSKS